MLDVELGSEESQNGSNGSSAPERAPGPVHKRIRMMSDSEPDSSPVKIVSAASNHRSKSLQLRDPHLTSTRNEENFGTLQHLSCPYIARLKSHHVEEDNSESDDDEFTGKGLVYDSDKEEEGPFMKVIF